MAAIQTLLSRLEGVSKEHVKGQLTCWSARCPAHNDRSPSLSITDNNGTILLHYHAGCPASAIVYAVGLSLADLFPRRISSGKPGQRQYWLAATAFKSIMADVTLVAAIASAMHQGREISSRDYEALFDAAQRLQRTAGVTNGY